MNLENYQKFKGIFSLIINNPEFNYENAIRYRDLYNPETDERSREVLINNVGYAIKNAKFFEIDKIEKRLMLLTETPRNKNILKEVRIPYPCIFLDINIKKEEMDYDIEADEIIGMIISELKEYDIKRIERNENIVEIKENPILNSFLRNRFYHITYGVIKGSYISIQEAVISIDSKENEIKEIGTNKKQYKFIKNFLINFLLFITNPEIELITINRNEKNAKRRERQNKMPLPSSHKIKLTGKIKRYVNALGNNLDGEGFNFRFWVRGHFRHYVADRFKGVKNKVIWIAPYMKGKGEIRDKIYSLEADKEDKKEYDNRFLFLDDIEPIKKEVN